MMSKVIRTSTAAAFLLTAGFITAQEPGAVPATAPVDPQAPAVRVAAQPGATTTAPAVATYRAKQILGSKILLKGDAAAGTVDDIVFDSAGNLEYLIVNNSDNKLVTVPWDAANFDLKNQTATLSITPEVYRTIPTYTTTTYPDYWTPAYRTATYKFYNLTPRELRRIDRTRLP